MSSDVVNPEHKLVGDNCKIENVKLQIVDKYNKVHQTGKEVKQQYFIVSDGARITQSHEGTDNAEVKVHWWYDPGTAVRYFVLYDVTGQNCKIV